MTELRPYLAFLFKVAAITGWALVFAAIAVAAVVIPFLGKAK